MTTGYVNTSTQVIMDPSNNDHWVRLPRFENWRELPPPPAGTKGPWIDESDVYRARPAGQHLQPSNNEPK